MTISEMTHKRMTRSRIDTQQNGTQQNDTQQNDSKQNDTQQNDTHPNNILVSISPTFYKQLLHQKPFKKITNPNCKHIKGAQRTLV